MELLVFMILDQVDMVVVAMTIVHQAVIVVDRLRPMNIVPAIMDQVDMVDHPVVTAVHQDSMDLQVVMVVHQEDMADLPVVMVVL